VVDVGGGHPFTSHDEEAFGCIDARHRCASLFGQLHGEPGTAASVEKLRAVADTERLERRLVERDLPRLGDLRPVLRGCAPERSLLVC
jgi:hypothetical protein